MSKNGTLACSFLLALAVWPTAVFAQPAKKLTGPAKVVSVLAHIAKTVKATKYQHNTVVLPAKGQFFFDCSGMAGWVLRRATPNALRVLGRPKGRRPLAVDFFRRINKIPLGKGRGPWQRVSSLKAVGPGDVISWKRPPWFPSKSTGHVAFVLSKGVVNKGPVPGYLFRIADATRYPHEADTRGKGESGFGTGVLLLAADPAAQPTGYGWYGSQSRPEWVVPADIAVGRPLR